MSVQFAKFLFATPLAAFLFVNVSRSQNVAFQRGYDGAHYEEGTDMKRTNDGGFIIAGMRATGQTNEDILLIKTNATGNVLWSKTYDHGRECATAVETVSGGYAATGWMKRVGSGTTDYDIFLMRTDLLGNTLWTKTYGSNYEEATWDFAATNDGGFIICGRTLGFGAASKDVYLIRTDGAGDTLWTRTYSTPAWQEANSVEQTTDGGFVLAGTASGAFLLKIDASGTPTWSTVFNGGQPLLGFAVQQTFDGGYALAGSVDMDSNTPFLIKTDANGVAEWKRVFISDVPGDNKCLSFQQTKDAGFILCGFTNGFSSDYDNLLIKTNSNGLIQWSKRYGGNFDEKCNYGFQHVVQTPDDGFAFSSSTADSCSSSNAVVFVKTDSTGYSGCDEFVAPMSGGSPQWNATLLNLTLGFPLTNVHEVTFTSEVGVECGFVCGTVGTSEIQNPRRLHIFPNPASDKISIAPLDLLNNHERIQVYNPLGISILSARLGANGLVDISDLASGVYVLVVPRLSVSLLISVVK